MELKITYLNMVSYGENTRKANLQELADGLCADEEMQYVLLESQKTASLAPIEVGEAKSIFTKLKKYPYEFEIDENLQLASVDGVKVENSNENSVSRAEFEELKGKVISTQSENELFKKQINDLSAVVSELQTNHKNKTHLITRQVTQSEVTLPKDETYKTLETLSLAGYGKGKAIVNYSAGPSWTGKVILVDGFAININGYPDDTSSCFAYSTDCARAAYWTNPSTSCCIEYDENTLLKFNACAKADSPVIPGYVYSVLLIPEE